MVNEDQELSTESDESERQGIESFPVKNAVTCGVCQSPADRYENRFQCQANPCHVGDLIVGIFSDLTPPESQTDDWTAWQEPETPSSQVKATRYNAPLGVMEVRFASGAVYRYDNVPPELYEAQHNAKSAGKFLNETFKVNAAKYPATKV